MGAVITLQTGYNIENPIGVLLSNKLNNDKSISPLLLIKHKKQQYMQILR